MISLNTAAPATLNVQAIPAARFPRAVEREITACADSRVMVCVSADASRFDPLMRKGLETARELGARLYLVHVETLSESFRGGVKETLRELLDRALIDHQDAEAVWIRAREPVGAMLEFAREAGIGRIVIGRGNRLSRSRFRRSCCAELIDRARNVAVEIVGY